MIIFKGIPSDGTPSAHVHLIKAYFDAVTLYTPAITAIRGTFLAVEKR